MIPLDHIDEIVEATESRMYAVCGKRMIEIRGKLVSVVGRSTTFSPGRVVPLAPGRSR